MVSGGENPQLESPCGRLRLQHGDFLSGNLLLADNWMLTARESPAAEWLWWACFSPQTPHELTYGFVLETARRLGSEPSSVLVRRDVADDAGELLAACGWLEREHPLPGVRMITPTGNTGTAHTYELPERALSFSMNNTSSELAWSVSMSPRTPEVLLQVMATALVDDSAVRRRSEIPAHHRERVSTAPPSTALPSRWAALLPDHAAEGTLAPTGSNEAAAEQPSPPPALVAVTPRHYAGPGAGDIERLRHRLEAEGWVRGEGVLTSACGRLGVAWPTESDKPRGWGRERTYAPWRIWGTQHRGAGVAWRVTGWRLVPQEIIEGLIGEATTMLDEADQAGRPPFEAGVLALGFLPLAAAGWTSEVTPKGAATFESPDGLLSARCGPPDALYELRGRPAARISCRRALGFWEVEISANTPSRLAAALCRDVADPGPLIRDPDHLRLDATDREVAVVTPVTAQSLTTSTSRRAAAVTRSLPAGAAASPAVPVVLTVSVPATSSHLQR
ncbi:DUF317 domain-containing protein [Kitasatospora sp. A2-31]|uniref:DUF317 domain-containing protein n=1 Tax=Kitasatospora sp. A2-31 TaxID=2916414 RepID=UPI001EECD1B5|nr:DUF317 domain-containing protein [Kitasatospora sp. A2-31]MCG6497054.1 DUF317 domain-containing protein [Kitasatospora sp. A2-31]